MPVAPDSIAAIISDGALLMDLACFGAIILMAMIWIVLLVDTCRLATYRRTFPQKGEPNLND